jgi:hypothetical protein
MMKDHRHEYEIGAGVREWQRLCRALPINDVAGRWFQTGLIDHLARGVDADDLGFEVRRQKLGKAPGAAAQIDDQRDRAPVDMRRQQVLP